MMAYAVNMHALDKLQNSLDKGKKQMGRNLRDLGWWELLTLGLARPDEEGGLQERKKTSSGWLGLGPDGGGGRPAGARLGREA